MKATRRDRYIKGIDSKSVLLTLFSPIPSDNVTIDTFPFTDMYAVHCAGDQVVRLTACDNAKKKKRKVTILSIFRHAILYYCDTRFQSNNNSFFFFNTISHSITNLTNRSWNSASSSLTNSCKIASWVNTTSYSQIFFSRNTPFTRTIIFIRTRTECSKQ